MAEVFIGQRSTAERSAFRNWLANTLLFLSGIPFFGSSAFAAEFTISVIDSATRQPIASRVYIDNTITGSRHFVRAHSHLDGVVYERKNWAYEKSIEHHTSVPAAPFVAENSPAGSYYTLLDAGFKLAPTVGKASGSERFTCRGGSFPPDRSFLDRVA